MKAVFLDIDGVLNSDRSFLAKTSLPVPIDACAAVRLAAKLDPSSIGLVNRLVARANAKIVIMSAWREGYTVPALQNLLRPPGLLVDRIAGKTPQMLDCPRGEEVQAWLDNYGRDVTKYVCIDDNNDFLPTQPLVQTDHTEGFICRDYRRACQLLGLPHD